MNSVISTDLLNTVIQNYPDGILVLNHTRQILLMNPAVRNMFAEAGVGLLEGEIFPYPVDHGFATEISLTRELDESSIFIGMNATLTSFGTEHLLLVAVRDISEKVRLQEELRGDALKDELTQLYNRKGFTSLAEHQLLVAQRGKEELTVIFLDLDGLKAINDSYGHAVGDRALVDFSSLLIQSVRKSDIVARLGGDEFVIIVVGKQALAAESILIRLSTHLHRFNSTEERPYSLSVSFGSAHYSHQSPSSLSELLEKADENMYTNKRAKKLTQWASSCANFNKIKYAG